MVANRVVAQDAKLLVSWNYVKNEACGLDPNIITVRSAKKAYWNCDKCHGCYDMRICERSNGHGCPYCNGRRVLEGYNDLASQRPDLLIFWSKDNVIHPNQITSNSHKIIKWHCNTCGGNWEQSANRQANVKGCPYCSGRRVLKGYNDLLTKYPDIAKEWSQDNDLSTLFPTILLESL